jgi:hypothetical protein
MVKMYAKSRVRVRRGDIAAASFSVGERDGWICASASAYFALARIFARCTLVSLDLPLGTCMHVDLVVLCLVVIKRYWRLGGAEVRADMLHANVLSLVETW